MDIAVISYKGGVGKTTTAVHVAAYMQRFGSTLLLDGDSTRNASAWAERGEGLPFKVADILMAVKLSRDYTHTVIDTGQRPSDRDLKSLAEGADLLIIPAAPATLDSEGLSQTIAALEDFGAKHYRILITKAPPPPETAAENLRSALDRNGVPTFSVSIPRLNAFEKAAAAGILVSEVDGPRAARAWQAYEQTGKEVLAYGKHK